MKSVVSGSKLRSMDEKHFGLQRRPFLAKVSGNDVFVGPQTAQTMAGIRDALRSQDAVVAIAGSAGAGKSTLVTKALEAVEATHHAVRIGRMSLKGTDILEFLLEQVGITKPPNGPIRQFAALRRRLEQGETAGKRVVVVVEDAVRMGAETLAELEALTAADAGDSSGAAIIIMGDERLGDFVRDPQLIRLAHRVRYGHAIGPMSEPELRGYLIHCFKHAGGDFAEAFDSRCVGTILELSCGIARVANNIVEAAMAAAAASGIKPVTPELIAEVASKEFGLEAELVPELQPQPAPEPVLEANPVTISAPEPEAESEPEPVIVFSDEPAEEDNIPELIQDTLPDLEILAPEIVEPEPEVSYATPVEPDLPELTPAAGNEPDALPTLDFADNPEPEPEPVVESTPDELPEWERDPTMAELKPDLDALEKAMAIAAGEADDGELPVLEDVAEPDEEVPQKGPVPEAIPEITLDNAIQERIDNNLIDEPGSVSAEPSEVGTESGESQNRPSISLPPRTAKKADAELERIASELAKAKTIEDVDDKLAETLFGEELSFIASQVLAKGAEGASANDEAAALFDTGTAQLAQAAGTPVRTGSTAGTPDSEVALETTDTSSASGIDLAASQRLNAVRALNTDMQSLEGSDPAADAPSREFETPEPIEDQINTSMTQTLKALDVRPPLSAHDDEDEDDEKKGGFFSRFRRS